MRELDNQGGPKSRVACLIDGFNLYHALDYFAGGTTTHQCHRYRKYKWLNLRRLAECYVRPRTEVLTSVHYFTTYAHWDRGKMERHQLYIRAQEAFKVEITLGKFKRKQVSCKGSCKQEFEVWEEKQTDVNIARKMMELAYLDDFDRLILISGDSDQVPSIEFVKANMKAKEITVVVPIGRSAEELKNVAHSTAKMKESHLRVSLLNETVLDRSGQVLQCPISWIAPTSS